MMALCYTAGVMKFVQTGVKMNPQGLTNKLVCWEMNGQRRETDGNSFDLLVSPFRACTHNRSGQDTVEREYGGREGRKGIVQEETVE
jgi:hypothetical protein